MSDSILDDDSIPPLPAIDIELTDTFPIPEDMPEEPLAELPDESLEKIEDAAEPDFEATMVIAPDASLSKKTSDNSTKEIEDEAEPDFEATMVIAPDAALSKKTSENSTEAFIERVKEQLSDSNNETAKPQEPFASTIPQ